MSTTTQKKRFTTLRAKFALLGHALRRSGTNDGPGTVSYLAERDGLARHLPTLNDAERFLERLGEEA